MSAKTRCIIFWSTVLAIVFYQTVNHEGGGLLYGLITCGIAAFFMSGFTCKKVMYVPYGGRLEPENDKVIRGVLFLFYLVLFLVGLAMFNQQ